jgi:hypothetical protein
MLHWKNPVACFIRDQVLYRARPKSAWVKQMETRLGSYEE